MATVMGDTSISHALTWTHTELLTKSWQKSGISSDEKETGATRKIKLARNIVKFLFISNHLIHEPEVLQLYGTGLLS
jgi:hypothetical protein